MYDVVMSMGDVLELRLDDGPGYRVYLGRLSKTTYVVLIGGDKSSQVHDIKVARKLLATMPSDDD